MRRRPRGLRLARGGLVGISAAGFTGIVAGLGPLNAQSTTETLDITAPPKSLGEPVDTPLALATADSTAIDEGDVGYLRRPDQPVPVLPERTTEARAGQLVLPPQLMETATTSSTSSSTTTKVPPTTPAPTTTRTAPTTTADPPATQPPATTSAPATTDALTTAPTAAPPTQAPTTTPTTQPPTTPAPPTTTQPPAPTTTTIATSTTSTTLPPLVGGS